MMSLQSCGLTSLGSSHVSCIRKGGTICSWSPQGKQTSGGEAVTQGHTSSGQQGQD
jgi:hypothetical protein